MAEKNKLKSNEPKNYSLDEMVNQGDFERFLISCSVRAYNYQKIKDANKRHIGEYNAYEFSDGVRIETNLIYGHGLTFQVMGANEEKRNEYDNKLDRILTGMIFIDFTDLRRKEYEIEGKSKSRIDDFLQDTE